MGTIIARQGQAITNFKQKLPSPTAESANQVFKDPYFFDFLNIGKEAQEREIEHNLMIHMEKILLELARILHEI